MSVEVTFASNLEDCIISNKNGIKTKKCAVLTNRNIYSISLQK